MAVIFWSGVKVSERSGLVAGMLVEKSLDLPRWSCYKDWAITGCQAFLISSP
jgi:hypothetical protein